MADLVSPDHDDSDRDRCCGFTVSVGRSLRGDLARYRRFSLDAVCFCNRGRSGSGVVNRAVHWILLASGCPIAKDQEPNRIGEAMKQTAMDLLALVGGGVAIIAGTVAVAYWLFKLFSEKWLTAKFDERLAAYKHQQQKELEELRFKISSLMDRTTKLYQREFDVLPEVWGKFVMAHGHVQSVTSALQQYPDLDRMPPEHLLEFLEKCPLANWEKEKIKNEVKKTDYYTDAINRHKAWEARNTYRDFYVYFRKNGIIIREEIKAKFDSLADLTHGALVEYEIGLRHDNDFRLWDARKKFASESEALLKALERDVQTRLWDSQKTLLQSS